MTTLALAMGGETRKGIQIIWSYRFNMAVMVARLSLTFVLMNLFTGRGRLDPELLAPTLIGYLVWFYAASGINTMGRNLMEEAQTGTLEQMYMTPAPTTIIVLGRALSSLATSTAMVLIIGMALALALGIRVPLRWEALPIFALTMIGLFGLGFAIAGATLVFKQVDQLTNLVDSILLFLSGALLPVHFLPGALEAFARTLPTTQGIIVIREVILEGRSLAYVWSDGGLPLLMIHSSLFLVVGWLTFKWCERIARGHGSLGQY